ncbi:MAG: hypothetical protein ACYC69_16435 [Thermodesulfovibrionales bacterium]
MVSLSMIRLLSAACILTFLFACSEKPQNPVSVYGDALTTSYQKGKQAGESGNLDALTKTIEAYHASNDRFPASLDEVKPLVGPKLDLSRYAYDPATGRVTLKPD